MVYIFSTYFFFVFYMSFKRIHNYFNTSDHTHRMLRKQDNFQEKTSPSLYTHRVGTKKNIYHSYIIRQNMKVKFSKIAYQLACIINIIFFHD
jgi:hypothetical protein